MNVSYSFLCRIKDALDQVGLQDHHIDYEFNRQVKLDVINLIENHMKDHQISAQVNKLRDLCNTYHGTEQLRARLSIFLKDFMDENQ